MASTVRSRLPSHGSGSVFGVPELVSSVGEVTEEIRSAE
jgi:hypothetical protein